MGRDEALLLSNRLADAWAALRHVPTGREWRRGGLELLWALPLMLLIGHVGHLVTVTPPPHPITLLGLAATLLFVPGLGEELLFRALIIPRERPSASAMAVSVLLFVLWHPLQAVTVGPPWAASFLDPWFLAIVTVLGVALARIYAATRSLWPCVAVHWLVVLSWKAFLGGPF